MLKLISNIVKTKFIEQMQGGLKGERTTRVDNQ